MPIAVLSEQEKARIRYHLGYLNITPAAAIQLGFPAASQTQFLVESAMNKIPDTAIGQIRQKVAILDGVEAKLVESQDRLAASSLGELTIREGEPDLLDKEYYRWACRLADDLGVPLNIYSERFRNGGGGAAPMNVPVY